MRLDFFMLADGASSPDGKVYVHGGAVTRASSPTLPTQVFVAGVLRLLVDPSDIGGPPHEVAFQWSRPDRAEWKTLLEAPVAPSVPKGGIREGEDVGFVIVAQMLIEFSVAGSHAIRVLLDGHEVCERRLYIDAPQGSGGGSTAAETTVKE